MHLKIIIKIHPDPPKKFRSLEYVGKWSEVKKGMWGKILIYYLFLNVFTMIYLFLHRLTQSAGTNMFVKYDFNVVLFSLMCQNVVHSKSSQVILDVLTARFIFFCSYHVILGKKILILELLPILRIDLFRSLLQFFFILLIIITLPLRQPKSIIQMNHGLLVITFVHINW